MKKIIWLSALLLTMTLGANAQDIQITNFERNYTSLYASTHLEVDNRGQACAVIRFLVREKGFKIEPNLGIVKEEVRPGEIILWVPSGTKRLTVKGKNLMSLTGYEIPVQIESKMTYEATLEVTAVGMQNRKASNKGHNVYVGAGYNIMSLSGPSVALGANINHHQIELEAVLGLNKTDDLYFYDSSGNVKTGYHYSTIRACLTYGYEIPLSDFFAITPMAGVSYMAYSGTALANSAKDSDFQNASSISAIGGLRLTMSLNNHFKLCVTPEYHGAISKDETCKLVSANDTTMKNWNTGINLNVGLLIFF